MARSQKLQRQREYNRIQRQRRKLRRLSKDLIPDPLLSIHPSSERRSQLLQEPPGGTS